MVSGSHPPAGPGTSLLQASSPLLGEEVAAPHRRRRTALGWVLRTGGGADTPRAAASRAGPGVHL